MFWPSLYSFKYQMYANADPKPKPIGALYFFYEKLGSGFSLESIASMIMNQKQLIEIPLYL